MFVKQKCGSIGSVPGMPDIPSVDTMRSPGGALLRRLVKDNLHAEWRHRSTVEVKRTVDVGIRGDVRMQSRPLQEIQGGDSLGQEATPEVQGKLFVCAA